MQRVCKLTVDFVSAISASSVQPLSSHHEISAPITKGRRIGKAHVRMSALPIHRDRDFGRADERGSLRMDHGRASTAKIRVSNKWDAQNMPAGPERCEALKKAGSVASDMKNFFGR